MMAKRNVYIAALAVLVAVCLSVMLLRASVQTNSWGLHFSQAGQPPQGPESAPELYRYNAFYLGDSSQKVLYLTFDAGYENGYTASILDTLKKHNVKATFFLVGHYLQTNPDLVRRMAQEGHVVGNHTMHHKDVCSLTKEGFVSELRQLEELYAQTTGKPLPQFYRPPEGRYNDLTLRTAGELGYKTVLWSLAYNDWDNHNQPDAAAAVEKLISRTHNGAVILLHSTSKTNAEILDTLLTRWKEMGYTFATPESL